MRNGYNQDLGRDIIAEREESIQTRYDAQGNVIRDYREEMRILSESEQRNVLPEIPIIVFDGCRKFNEHIKNTNVKPIVRQVKLVPLGKPKRIRLTQIVFDIVNEFFGWVIGRRTDAPLFNRKKNHKLIKRLYALNNSIVKQARTYEK
nr:hypothetical protein [uncultured Flavobacterium sp.]